MQHFRKAADAIDAGVAVIHQELQYVPELSVMENLLLGRLPTRFGLVDRRRALAWTRERLDALGVDLDPRAKLKQLSIGQRQMVEIVKAILRDAKILALDEPTSSLSHRGNRRTLPPRARPARAGQGDDLHFAPPRRDFRTLRCRDDLS